VHEDWQMLDNIPPGGGILGPEVSYFLGRTGLGHTFGYAFARCACKRCGNSWTVVECFGAIGIQVSILKGMNPTSERRVREEEAEHVRDLRNGMETIRQAGINTENVLRNRIFATKEECVNTSSITMRNALINAKSPIALRSKATYDEGPLASHKHREWPF
jgi:hypothetical protein